MFQNLKLDLFNCLMIFVMYIIMPEFHASSKLFNLVNMFGIGLLKLCSESSLVHFIVSTFLLAFYVASQLVILHRRIQIPDFTIQNPESRFQNKIPANSTSLLTLYGIHFWVYGNFHKQTLDLTAPDPLCSMDHHGRWILTLEYPELTALWHHLKEIVESKEKVCPPKRDRKMKLCLPHLHEHQKSHICR